MNRQLIREDVIDLARRQPEEALERCHALVAAFPREVWTWSLRSHVHNTRGDLKNSISDIDHAILLDFNQPGSHLKRANYLVKMLDYQEAICALSNAIEIGQSVSFEYHSNTCRFVRAFCFCKLGKFSCAEDDLSYLEDGMMFCIDKMRTKYELLEACRKRCFE